jgi:hypothetical protein
MRSVSNKEYEARKNVNKKALGGRLLTAQVLDNMRKNYERE